MCMNDAELQNAILQYSLVKGVLESFQTTIYVVWFLYSLEFLFDFHLRLRRNHRNHWLGPVLSDTLSGVVQ